jgi:hypothetical protein
MSAGILSTRRCDGLTGMFILELGQVIDILVHDNPQIIALVVRCDIALGEGFGHSCGDEREVE